MPSDTRYDEIGYWSEIKLDIIQKYAAAYSKSDTEGGGDFYQDTRKSAYAYSKQAFVCSFLHRAWAGASMRPTYSQWTGRTQEEK